MEQRKQGRRVCEAKPNCFVKVTQVSQLLREEMNIQIESPACYIRGLNDGEVRITVTWKKHVWMREKSLHCPSYLKCHPQSLWLVTFLLEYAYSYVMLVDTLVINLMKNVRSTN